MKNVMQAAEPAIALLLEAADERKKDKDQVPGPDTEPEPDEDYLYAELGKRLSAMSRSTAGSDQFDMTADEAIEAYGPWDEMKNLGKKFFNRWNRAAHELCCGSDPEDADARKKVHDALGLGEQAVGAAIAGLLVAQFGLAAAIAGVVAVIIVRLFFRPAGQAMCEYWKEKL